MFAFTVDVTVARFIAAVHVVWHTLRRQPCVWKDWDEWRRLALVALFFLCIGSSSHFAQGGLVPALLLYFVEVFFRGLI